MAEPVAPDLSWMPDVDLTPPVDTRPVVVDPLGREWVRSGPKAAAS